MKEILKMLGTILIIVLIAVVFVKSCHELDNQIKQKGIKNFIKPYWEGERKTQ